MAGPPRRLFFFLIYRVSATKTGSSWFPGEPHKYIFLGWHLFGSQTVFSFLFLGLEQDQQFFRAWYPHSSGVLWICLLPWNFVFTQLGQSPLSGHPMQRYWWRLCARRSAGPCQIPLFDTIDWMCPPQGLLLQQMLVLHSGKQSFCLSSILVYPPWLSFCLLLSTVGRHEVHQEYWKLFSYLL